MVIPASRGGVVTCLEDEAVAYRPEQVPELSLGALLGVDQGQHDHVHAAHEPVVPRVLLARLAQAVVVDDHAGARLECGDQVAQDTDRVGGRVVVEDPPEVVDCIMRYGSGTRGSRLMSLVNPSVSQLRGCAVV